MPELQFPDPVDQQTYEAAGLVWTWNDSLKCWSSDPVSLPEQGAPVIVSSGEPAVRPDGTALKNGDLWFKTSGTSPQLYVYQTSNSSWVVASWTAAPGTVEQANKVRVSGSASGGTRPIATFGDSSSVSGGSYTDIKYPASPPTVTNDGKITAPGGFQGNVDGKATTAGKISRTGINASSTASYRVMLGPNSNTPGDNGFCHVVQDANPLYYQPSTDKLICGTFQGNLSGNASTASTATDCSRSVTGSNGLTGGGTLNQNQVISGVNASTGAKGVVQLNDSTAAPAPQQLQRRTLPRKRMTVLRPTPLEDWQRCIGNLEHRHQRNGEHRQGQRHQLRNDQHQADRLLWPVFRPDRGDLHKHQVPDPKGAHDQG